MLHRAELRCTRRRGAEPAASGSRIGGGERARASEAGPARSRAAVPAATTLARLPLGSQGQSTGAREKKGTVVVVILLPLPPHPASLTLQELSKVLDPWPCLVQVGHLGGQEHSECLRRREVPATNASASKPVKWGE